MTEIVLKFSNTLNQQKQASNLFFLSVADGHNGQPKVTIDHWGWGDDSTTSSVVGNFENQNQGNWLESANDYDEMVQRSHLCYQERQR